MPELPEVETVRRGLQNAITGKVIDFVEVKDAKPLRGLSVKGFEQLLIDRTFKVVDRVGKLLLLGLDNGMYLAIHLKMTGQLIYKDGKNEIMGGHEVPGADQMKYTRVIFNFKDGSKLFFNDLRKFGYIELIDEAKKNDVVAKYGPDPTRDEFNGQVLKERIAKRRAPIKALLLNQNLIAGIGNIYADESCFKAGVMPSRPANQVSDEEFDRLATAIIEILNKAVQVGGTTFRNYVGTDGRNGNYSDYLCVFGRSGQECPVCGEKILKQKTAGRGTHFCPHCQS